MIRNTAGQVVTANLVSRADGTPITSGTVTVEVLGNGGTKSAGSGTIENEGGGTWSYFPTQAETNYAAITFSFTHADAIRVDVQVNTVAEPSAEVVIGDLGDAIANVAAGPKQASADGQSVTSQSIDDLIKADKYLAAKRNTAAGRSGIRLGVFRSPGSVGDVP